MLLHLFKENEIDGMTLVYSEAVGAWKAMHDVPQLKEAIVKIQEEEEEQERALERARAMDAQQQVYIVDEEGLQQLVSFAKEKEVVARAKGKKSFTADDGQRYVWDEAEQSWVEDEEGSEVSEHDDEEKDEEEEDENQGVLVEGEQEKKASNEDEGVKVKKRKRKQRRPKKTTNLWVYITGLPLDVTLEEVRAHFSKVGLIAISATDQRPKIKLYMDEAGQLKGDASICYNAEESVQMAVDVLSGGYIRPAFQITVTRAEFKENDSKVRKKGVEDGGGEGGRGKKSTVSHQQVKVAMSAMSQALSWNEDDDGGASKFSFLKIVVLENMFTPSDFDDEEFLPELEEDIATECGKVGEIEKITVFSSNPRGIVVVKFSTAFAAQRCIELMDGRFFGGKKIR